MLSNMLNLSTIPNGFIINELEYIFDGDAEILYDIQAHVPTDKGVIFLDTSVTIDGQTFTTIQLFLSYLYIQTKVSSAFLNI